MLTALPDHLLILAGDGVNGRELWSLSAAGGDPVLIADLNPGAADGFDTLANSIFDIVAVGDLAYFRARYGEGAGETTLFVTDGTAEGTRVAQGIDLASGGAPYPSELTPFGDGLVFVGTPEPEAFELMYADAGRDVLERLTFGANDLSSDTSAAELTVMGDRVFFRAYDPEHGFELWSSDGTAAGTGFLVDLNEGGAGSFPDNLTAVGDQLFFTAETGGIGEELYVTDGAAAGTRLVADLEAGSAGSRPYALQAAGDRLYFSAIVGGDIEAWVSDGTADGTFSLGDLTPGSSTGGANDFFALGDEVVFMSGYRLWITDGTPEGTRALFDEADPFEVDNFGVLQPYAPVFAFGGTEGSDDITANALDNEIDGGAGDDRLDGRGGHDVINAGLGDDVVVGGFGADLIRGGEGADVIYGDGIA